MLVCRHSEPAPDRQPKSRSYALVEKKNSETEGRRERGEKKYTNHSHEVMLFALLVVDIVAVIVTIARIGPIPGASVPVTSSSALVVR